MARGGWLPTLLCRCTAGQQIQAPVMLKCGPLGAPSNIPDIHRPRADTGCLGLEDQTQ